MLPTVTNSYVMNCLSAGSQVTFRTYGFLSLFVLGLFVFVNFYKKDTGFQTNLDPSEDPRQVRELITATCNVPTFSTKNGVGINNFKGSVSPSNEYPLYFSYDRKSLFSPLDAIKVLSGLEIIILSFLIIFVFRYLQQLQLTH